MELLTNPWFIIFTGLNILALIYLAIKFYYKNKEKPLLFERLRDADVHITIRTPPPKPSDLKGGDIKENKD